MILRNSIIITAFLIASQLLAILRERMFANMVGIGPTLDMYNASFRLPDLMLGVMMSFVAGSAVMPLMYKYKEQSEKSYNQYLSSLFIFFFFVMILIALILLPLAQFVIPPMVKGFDAKQIVDTVYYSQLLLIQPILLGISFLASAIAQSKNRFILYGLGPIFYSLGVIITFYFYYDDVGIISAVYGAIIGAFLQAVTQFIVLYKEKIYPSFQNYKFSYIKEHIKIALPRSGSQIVSQLKLIYITYLGSIIGAGAISTFALVHKVYDVFTQLVASSISTASLPKMSEYYSKEKYDEYNKVFRKGYVSILAISVFVSFFAYLFSRELVYLIFGNIIGADLVSDILRVMFIIFPLVALNWYMSIACNSKRDTKRPFFSNLLSLVTVVISGQYFYNNDYGIWSVVYSVLLGFVVSFVLLSYFNFRKEK